MQRGVAAVQQAAAASAQAIDAVTLPDGGDGSTTAGHATIAKRTASTSSGSTGSAGGAHAHSTAPAATGSGATHAHTSSRPDPATALLMHELSGIKAGDVFDLSKWSAHCSIYRCDKLKEVPTAAVAAAAAPATTDGATASSAPADAAAVAAGDDAAAPAAAGADAAPADASGAAAAAPSPTWVARYLCLSRERLLVLQAHPTKIGKAIVKSNHHLSELAKLSYSKKDATRITLYYRRGIASPSLSVASSDSGDARPSGDAVVMVTRVYRMDAMPEFRALLQDYVARLSSGA